MPYWPKSLPQNEREINGMLPVLAAISQIEPQFRELSDIDLAATTIEFKDKIAHGATLDDLLIGGSAARWPRRLRRSLRTGRGRSVGVSTTSPMPATMWRAVCRETPDARPSNRSSQGGCSTA